MPFHTLAQQAADELKSERRTRACMIIHSDSHTVLDMQTGVRYPLPAHEAWKKLGELNNIENRLGE